MNLYGWSKHLFDLALVDRVAKKESCRRNGPGCKFFNVFGPNEYHKGEMMSLVAKRFDDVKAGKHREAVQIAQATASTTATSAAISSTSTMWWRWCAGCCDTPSVSGIFNVGTGKARSFRDLISAMYRGARNARRSIEYVDMPGNNPWAVSVFHARSKVG